MTKERFFETTAGEKIKIQPISILDLQLAQDAVKREFRDRGEQIDPPTYKVDVLGGEVEYHPYTEESIKDAGEEDKAAWDAHLEATEKMKLEVEGRTALVFLEGILVDLPEDDTWIKRRKRLFGEVVPEDKEERLLHYVNHILLKTPADQEDLTFAIYRLSMTGANKEAIQAMEELFRGEMDEAGREGLEAIKALTEKKAKDLVLQPPATGRSSSKGAGNDSKATKGTARGGSGRNNRRRKRAK